MSLQNVMTSGEGRPQSIAEHFPVGEVAVAVTAPFRERVEVGELPSQELLNGNVLRRVCARSGESCAKLGCQALEGYDNELKDCADQNYAQIFASLGIGPEQVLAISLTDNNVGFYDQLESYNPTKNSVDITEVVGFNAFFARANDEVALGGRFADCAFIALEFQDAAGEDVIGMVHLTITNIQGESQFNFEIDGQPVGAFSYFLESALEHYGADKATVRARLVTAITGENIPYTFDPASSRPTGQHPERRFPGWLEHGMVTNQTDPNWQNGDPINPEHIWIPHFREMARRQLDASGLSDDQIIEENVVDPGVAESGYASNHAAFHGRISEARDAYAVVPRNLLKTV